VRRSRSKFYDQRHLLCQRRLSLKQLRDGRTRENQEAISPESHLSVRGGIVAPDVVGFDEPEGASGVSTTIDTTTDPLQTAKGNVREGS